jgi:hypothetical protein
VLTVAVIAVISVFATVFGENWVIQTVDNEGDAGYVTRSWYDSQGRPNMVYGIGSTLFHSRWSGDGWLKTQIDGAPQDLPNTGISFVQIAPDSVAISYSNEGSLRCALWNGSVWTIKPLTGSYSNSLGHIPNRIAIDTSGAINIFCYSSVFGNCYHQVKLNSAGALVYIGSIPQFGDVGDNASFSVAFDSQNRIYLVYRTTAGNLKMAYYNGTTWGTEYIDQASGANVGLYCRLILDQNDVPHIVYYDATNTQLKYATWQATPKVNKQQDGR